MADTGSSNLHLLRLLPTMDLTQSSVGPGQISSDGTNLDQGINDFFAFFADQVAKLADQNTEQTNLATTLMSLPEEVGEQIASELNANLPDVVISEIQPVDIRGNDLPVAHFMGEQMRQEVAQKFNRVVERLEQIGLGKEQAMQAVNQLVLGVDQELRLKFNEQQQLVQQVLSEQGITKDTIQQMVSTYKQFAATQQQTNPMSTAAATTAAEATTPAKLVENFMSMFQQIDKPAMKSNLLGMTETAQGVATLQQAIATHTQNTTANRPMLASVQVPVHEPAWKDAVFEQVIWAANKRLPSAVINLEPPELGPLRVSINLGQDNTTSIQFSSQHAPVREALDNGLWRLREMFADMGLPVDVNVSDQSTSQHARDEMADNADSVYQDSQEADDEQGSSIVSQVVSNTNLVDSYA